VDVRTRTESVARDETAASDHRQPLGRVPPECPLTALELAVLRELSRGVNRQQAATVLGIAVPSVDVHLEAAASKLGTHTPMQAIAACIRAEWIGPIGGPEDRARERESNAPSTELPYGCPLTRVQLETLRLVGDGLSYKEVAAKRQCSVSTVRTHVHLICSKLNVSKCSQAVLLGYKQGWLHERGDTQTSRQIRRLADATEELVVCLRGRKPHMPPALRHYLACFDDLLVSREEDERTRARELMEESLARVLREKGVSPRRGRDHSGALTKLVETLIAERSDTA
jgi:DNA-binding CsgD family transcriptional regulator